MTNICFESVSFVVSNEAETGVVRMEKADGYNAFIIEVIDVRECIQSSKKYMKKE
jgi:hypothetical protein